MKEKLKLASLSILLSTIIQPAFAESGKDWIIRGRALQVQTDVSSKVSTLGGAVATNSDQIPELDFTRFFTPNIAAELILGTTRHDVSLRGSPVLGNKTDLGKVSLLPPTLTAQYHFNPRGTFRPYAGAGLNYTIFYNAKAPGGTVTSVKYQDHLSYAFQAGFDYMINDTWSINVDVKKIYLKTNVQVNDSYTAKVRLNPWLMGVGVGYHF
jgi:outer membrane protein